LRGDDLANALDGRGGDDLLVGRAGDDTLYGRGGDDEGNGGMGSDTCYVEAPVNCE
jgi:serralysin